MRLDKYLKVSRILKRRSVSKEMADHSRVLVNGKPAKPAYTVKLNDIIEIVFGNRSLKVRVLNVQATIRKEDADQLYEVIDEEI